MSALSPLYRYIDTTYPRYVCEACHDMIPGSVRAKDTPRSFLQYCYKCSARLGQYRLTSLPGDPLLGTSDQWDVATVLMREFLQVFLPNVPYTKRAVTTIVSSIFEPLPQSPKLDHMERCFVCVRHHSPDVPALLYEALWIPGGPNYITSLGETSSPHGCFWPPHTHIMINPPASKFAPPAPYGVFWARPTPALQAKLAMIEPNFKPSF